MFLVEKSQNYTLYIMLLNKILKTHLISFSIAQVKIVSCPHILKKKEAWTFCFSKLSSFEFFNKFWSYSRVRIIFHTSITIMM